MWRRGRYVHISVFTRALGHKKGQPYYHCGVSIASVLPLYTDIQILPGGEEGTRIQWSGGGTATAIRAAVHPKGRV